MRVVFHIGTHKTGSTTLQETFTRNADVLAEHGICYPSISSYPQHTQLIFADTDDEEFPGSFARRVPEKREAGKVQAEEFWNAVREQVTKSKFEVLLLSSEFVFGMRPRSQERLIERLRTFGEHVHCVGYMRSPASHSVSALQQTLKYGDEVIGLDKIPVLGSKYRAASRLPVDQLTIKKFERSAFLYDCICKDFAKTILNLPEGVIQSLDVVNSNESVSAEAMAILKDFNHYHSPGLRRAGNALSLALIDRIQATETALGLTKPKLLESMKHAIENELRDDISWLKDHAGLVFEDFDYDGGKPISYESRRLIENRAITALDRLVQIDWAACNALCRRLLIGLTDELIGLSHESYLAHRPGQKADNNYARVILEELGWPDGTRLDKTDRLRRRVLIRLLRDAPLAELQLTAQPAELSGKTAIYAPVLAELVIARMKLPDCDPATPAQ